MPDASHYDLDTPPQGLDELVEVLAVCGGIQAAVAVETALERLLVDLPRAVDRSRYGEAAHDAMVLWQMAVRSREQMAAGGARLARRVVSSIWSFYSGALLWDELVRLLAEQLGHTVVGAPRPVDLGALDLEPWDGSLASILQSMPDSYADQLADDAQRFLVRWWQRLCERLAFRRALTATLE